MTDTPELLPCPFCGGAPHVRQVMGETWVVCGSCAASTNSMMRASVAFDLWNRRAAAPSVQPGALGEEPDTAFKVASDLHAAFEQLIYGLPKYLEAENLTDEANMIREAYITLDVTAHRLSALQPVAQKEEG